MSRKRMTIAISATLCLCLAAALLLRHPIIRSWSGLAAEDYVFEAVHVGTTEQQLVELLDRHQIDYSISIQQGQRLYSHTDSFMGVCFYYVVDGRVIQVIKD